MLNKIKNDLKEAMKSGDKEKLNPLRNLVSKIKMKEIEIGRPLKDEESLKVCNSVAKQIKESIIQLPLCMQYYQRSYIYQIYQSLAPHEIDAHQR